MANIEDKVQQIRNAVYGKDVRESIASGLEVMNDEIETFITDITEQQNNFEQTLNEAEAIRNVNETNRQNAEAARQQEEQNRVDAENARVQAEQQRVSEFATIKADYEAATHENTVIELTQARTDTVNNITYGNLQERLDAHSSQLADNTNQIGILNKKTESIISVKEFGAVGDSVVDDTQSIRNAITQAVSIGNNVTLHFPACSGYRITDTIDIPDKINVVMDAPVIYDGPMDRVALSVGSLTVHNYNVVLKLSAKAKMASDWSNDNSIGIRVINAFTANIHIVRTEGFTVGCEFLATNRLGFTMSNIILGHFTNNKYGLQIANTMNGWPNGNVFIGGLFSGGQGKNASKECYSIRLVSKDNTYKGNNSNVFYGTHFEAGKQNIPVLIEHGNENQFLNTRAENNSDNYFAIVKSGNNNIFDTALLLTGSNKVASYGANFENFYLPDKRERLIFDSGNLAERAVQHTDKSIKIDGVNFAYYYNTNVYEDSPIESNAQTAAIYNDYIYINNPRVGISVFIDTSQAKEFVIVPELKSGEYNLVLVCYDANGAILSGQIPILDNDDWGYNLYVKHNSSAPYFEYPGFGNGYKFPEAQNDEIKFKVKDEVKEVRVILLPNTTLSIKGFKIYSMRNLSANVYSKIKKSTIMGIVPNVNNLPTPGASFRGKIIRVEGGIGVADKLYICMKTSADTYSWVQIATG